jgi:hypothetical protein
MVDDEAAAELVRLGENATADQLVGVKSSERRLYHVTRAENVHDILLKGLLPQVGQRAEAAGVEDAAIFCFTSRAGCDEAVRQWSADVRRGIPGDQLIFLEIELPSGLHSFDSAPNEVAVLERIPAGSITWFSDDWQKMNPREHLVWEGGHDVAACNDLESARRVAGALKLVSSEKVWITDVNLHDVPIESDGAVSTAHGRRSAILSPDFGVVRDKRMSELTPAQRDDAREQWLRDQIGTMPEYHRDFYEFLLQRLDGAREAGRAAEIGRDNADHKRSAELASRLRSLVNECASDPLLLEACRPSLERIVESIKEQDTARSVSRGASLDM